MLDPQLKKIIDKLIEKSKSKNAIWNKTSSENEFKIKLRSSILTSDLWTDDRNGQQFVDLIIRNHRGDVINRVVFNKTESPQEYTQLEELNNWARKSYYKVDETIKDIFDELSSDYEVGETDELPF